eukprot:scaffold1016_cov175-Ochromonas_danica.AAC.9
MQSFEYETEAFWRDGSLFYSHDQAVGGEVSNVYLTDSLANLLPAPLHSEGDGKLEGGEIGMELNYVYFSMAVRFALCAVFFL